MSTDKALDKAVCNVRAGSTLDAEVLKMKALGQTLPKHYLKLMLRVRVLDRTCEEIRHILDVIGERPPAFSEELSEEASP